MFAENARRAKAMLDNGTLNILIVYYFFWPGQANVDLHRKMLEDAGLWGHPRVASMIDVESAGGRITGNHSPEINDEIARLRGWYDNPDRVIGYFNPIADPGLWTDRPGDLKLVVPHYNNRPGDSYDYPGRFAHQYSDAAPCRPFGPCDGNFTGMDLPELESMLGIGEQMSKAEQVMTQLSGDNVGSTAGNFGWKQLRPFDGFSIWYGKKVDRLSVVEAIAQLVFESTLRIVAYRNGLKANEPETVLGHAAAAHGAALDANDKLDTLAAEIAAIKTQLARPCTNCACATTGVATTTTA
ncbi:hypothetical protein IU485_28075 [Nocardia cyriacigeorgica]|uniref:hypothetical protein n=1 Tax=Nocardia cyriacigeorgica TaxID=135487 RepID=UPI00189552A9|nr:hypothetical protein [Nocardia cyriacigeorgica]MBF6085231.1 hypothetical protein [Nocardia cyriacigeorgica]